MYAPASMAGHAVPICTVFGETRTLELEATGTIGDALPTILSREELARLNSSSLLWAVVAPPAGAPPPAPLFLATGTVDPVHPVENARVLADALRARESTVVQVESEGVGHSVCHPSAVESAALAFVQRAFGL